MRLWKPSINGQTWQRLYWKGRDERYYRTTDGPSEDYRRRSNDWSFHLLTVEKCVLLRGCNAVQNEKIKTSGWPHRSSSLNIKIWWLQKWIEGGTGQKVHHPCEAQYTNCGTPREVTHVLHHYEGTLFVLTWEKMFIRQQDTVEHAGVIARVWGRNDTCSYSYRCNPSNSLLSICSPIAASKKWKQLYHCRYGPLFEAHKSNFLRRRRRLHI